MWAGIRLYVRWRRMNRKANELRRLEGMVEPGLDLEEEGHTHIIQVDSDGEIEGENTQTHHRLVVF